MSFSSWQHSSGTGRLQGSLCGHARECVSVTGQTFLGSFLVCHQSQTALTTQVFCRIDWLTGFLLLIKPKNNKKEKFRTAIRSFFHYKSRTETKSLPCQGHKFTGAAFITVIIITHNIFYHHLSTEPTGSVFVWPHALSMSCMICMTWLLTWLLHSIMTNTTMHVMSLPVKVYPYIHDKRGYWTVSPQTRVCMRLASQNELLATVHPSWAWSIWGPAHGINAAFRTITWWKISVVCSSFVHTAVHYGSPCSSSSCCSGSYIKMFLIGSNHPTLAAHLRESKCEWHLGCGNLFGD